MRHREGQQRSAWVTSMGRGGRRCWVAAGLLVLAGCAKDRATSGGVGTGELGKGDFLLVCTAEDATCEAGQNTAARPDRIAFGSTFQLAYAGEVPANPQGEPTRIDILPASGWHLSQQGLQLTAIDTGFTALLARTAEGTITDFVHLEIVEPTALSLEGQNTLAPGAEEVFRAAPVDAQGITLAGSLQYTWESSDPQVIEVIEATGRTARVAARGPGTANLTASAGPIEAQAELTVEDP